MHNLCGLCGFSQQHRGRVRERQTVGFAMFVVVQAEATEGQWSKSSGLRVGKCGLWVIHWIGKKGKAGGARYISRKEKSQVWKY